MNTDIILRYLRQFLLGLVAFMCSGTIFELLVIGHTKESLQFVPIVLCILGLGTSLVVLRNPQRKTIQIMRLIMLVLIAGSLLGVYEHLVSNLEFVLETKPNASFFKMLFSTLGGASPMLAPGMLAIAGVLAIAATYYHPSLYRT